MGSFARKIRPFVDAELNEAAIAAAAGRADRSFEHLERAHVLGQASTFHHVRVHVRMLAWAIRQRDLREALGQVFRIIGAATKTVFGLVPVGNTGGANVSPVKPMPVPADLASQIAAASERD